LHIHFCLKLFAEFSISMTDKDLLSQIRGGRTDLIVRYLDSGYPATSSDTHGVSLIQWCAYYGDVTAISYLLAKGERLDSLGLNFDLNGAAFHGYPALCAYLLENGADVNASLGDTGETSLHAALSKTSRIDYEQLIQVLLNAGADPNAETKPGVETGAFMRDCRTRRETPLHRAAAFAPEAVIKMLLDAGAKRDAKDMNGDSPLTWASWHLRPRTILKLLCYGDFQVS
jgi:ankyrin repeat protein